ncbi:MAG: pentapeptide repeat-containing protein [Leptospiraceae bacterium]|nr:pentapeptide repeat-containing protein [Leptospiraceae bacterium]
MDFERFKAINDQRLNYREMEDATVVSSYRNVGCGDGYRLYLKIDEESEEKRILDASYTTTGCGFGLAALAMATEWVRGKTLEEAAAITSEDVEGLFEFPERRKNYPDSAVEALQKAVADYRNGTGIKPEDRITRSYALEKLKEQGHLRGEKLTQVILEGEDFSGVDLAGANLQNAFLQNASFEGANLRGARLRGAFLNNCNLKNADLREADLRWAKLTGADIEGAQFEDAIYDIGTRLDPRQTQLFKIMKREGRDLYTEKEPQKA